MAILKSEPTGFRGMRVMKFHYPSDATIAGLLTVPPELRETVLRKCLSGASEAEKDPHIARVMERLEQIEKSFERQDADPVQGTRTAVVRPFRVAKVPKPRAATAGRARSTASNPERRAT